MLSLLLAAHTTQARMKKTEVMLKKNYKVASTEGQKKKKQPENSRAEFVVVVVFFRPVRGGFFCFQTMHR